ncbi:hypothetical protein [Symbioplanes lichenis]|uniref:hypothetical protein n=1 Tax=Symbioplanes lichenis TaxID=1629072 RepID=UPI0027391AF9|nr:hypothetical protein [Actinoplanes lichenis]
MRRRRLVTPIAVLTGLFGLGAASAHAAGRVTAADKADAAASVASAQVPRASGMELIATYRGDEKWRSSRMSIPKAAYQAVVEYKCDDSGFLYVSWTGEPNSYEESHASAGKGTVVLNGTEGARRGYFAIDTWLNCSWTMNLYS